MTSSPNPAVLPDARAREVRLRMFLEILQASCGQADASDYRWNWINAFCGEHEGYEPDTFNTAHDVGYTTVSHDSDTDSGIVRLTDAGRAYLATPPASDAAVPAYPDNTYTPYGRRSVHNLAKALGIVEQDPTVVSVINKASDEITFLRALAAAPKVASEGAGLDIEEQARGLLRQQVGDGEKGVSITWGGNPSIDAHAAPAAIRAALATDVTDGATGCGYPAGATIAVDACGPVTTTPGGDLLEQTPPTPNKDEAR